LLCFIVTKEDGARIRFCYVGVVVAGPCRALSAALAMGAAVLLMSTAGSAQKRPPNYSVADMPETDFDCRDRTIGGYYADPETECQMFHVCVKVPGIGVSTKPPLHSLSLSN